MLFIRIVKNSFIALLLFNVALPSVASYIINIGIKSKLSNYTLSNCRFGSALQLDKTRDKVSISNPGNTKNAKIIGLRQSADKLPDTYRGSHVEFDNKVVLNALGENLKYSVRHNKDYPAILFKDWSVVDFVGSYAKHYYYKVGMALFSSLPKGVNAASIYTKGELDFSYRMTDGEGQLECDIYDMDGHALGLVDYVTNSDNGSFKTLPYGKSVEEVSKNNNILKSFSLDAKTTHQYLKYPKKRILLTISDANATAGQVKASKPRQSKVLPPPIVNSTHQSKVENNTDDYSLGLCTKADTHGSWVDYPSVLDQIEPGQYFTFSMKSIGHGIQGEIDCYVYFVPPSLAQHTKYLVANLFVEINNDGTAFALFPYVNLEGTSNDLVKAGYKYTLYVESDGNYSLKIYQ